MTTRSRKYFNYQYAVRFIKNRYNGTVLDCSKNGRNNILYPIPQFIDGRIQYGFEIDSDGCIHGSSEPIVLSQVFPDEPQKGDFQGFRIKMELPKITDFSNCYIAN